MYLRTSVYVCMYVCMHICVYVCRVREGIAGYHFVFESFWYVRMIS